MAEETKTKKQVFQELVDAADAPLAKAKAHKAKREKRPKDKPLTEAEKAEDLEVYGGEQSALISVVMFAKTHGDAI